jgi:hypothetical protein
VAYQATCARRPWRPRASLLPAPRHRSCRASNSGDVVELRFSRLTVRSRPGLGGMEHTLISTGCATSAKRIDPIRGSVKCHDANRWCKDGRRRRPEPRDRSEQQDPVRVPRRKAARHPRPAGHAGQTDPSTHPGELTGERGKRLPEEMDFTLEVPFVPDRLAGPSCGNATTAPCPVSASMRRNRAWLSGLDRLPCRLSTMIDGRRAGEEDPPRHAIHLNDLGRESQGRSRSWSRRCRPNAS